MPPGYDRMVIVAVDCPECEAVRGEPCRSLIVTYKNDGTTYRPHYFRRERFDSWRQKHPNEYAKLAVQTPQRKDFDIEGIAC